eukprot:1213933-Lingulodinium_polyedra.AAC.1
MRRPAALVGSFFAEMCTGLATAVQKTWAQWAEAGGGCPHQKVASDVWKCLRDGAAPLRRALEA